MDGLTEEDEVRAWCQKHRLSEDTFHVLRQEGFTSFQFLRLLTAEELDKWLKQPRLLPLAQALALQHALELLKDEQDCQEEPMETPGSPQLQLTTATHHHHTTHPLTGGVDGSQPQQQHPHVPQQGGCQQQQKQNFVSEDQASAMSESHPPSAAADKHKALDSFEMAEDIVPDVYYRFLLVGKTGSGKSVTGNSILGADLLNEDVAFDSVTSRSQLKRGIVDGKMIEIMDSPGLFDTRQTHEEISVDIVKTVACMHPGPHAILYVIRLGRYTEEEYEVYTRLKALFDGDVSRYVIVVFTGGDSLEKEGKSLEEILQEVPPKLQKVLQECQHRVVLFNNVSSDRTPYVRQLFRVVEQLLRSNGGGCYTSPRYAEVGQEMEEEVQRRLQEMEKEHLAQKPYVQREHERQLEAKVVEAKAEEEMQRLLEDMKSKDLILQQQQKEREELLERYAREKEETRKEMEQRREQDKQAMERKKRELNLVKRKAEEEQRRFLEAKKRVYERKIAEMKEKIAKDEEPVFLNVTRAILPTVISALPAVVQFLATMKQ